MQAVDERSERSERSERLRPSVAVVGAGIIGVCTAYALQKYGWQVTLVDPAEPGSECSSGNAGAISAGSVAPLAMPGAMKNAVRMLLDAEGPLYVPARYWLQAAPWLARFLRASSPARVEAIADALAQLFAGSLENHQALAREVGCPQRIVQTGQLHLYRDAGALAKDDAAWRLRRARGVQCILLDRNGIGELEPAVSHHYRIGVFMPEQGAVTEPFRYAAAIAEAFCKRGGTIVRDRVLGLEKESDGWLLRGAQRSTRSTRVVIAAGAWSAALLRPLGWRVPLESQRGYHVHVPEPGVSVSRPVVLADRKVFISPMETGLRIAGTVEFGGLRMPPTERRAALLRTAARQALPGLDDSAGDSVWMGHRPCLPDSLPVLGPVPRLPGLWCAFGHGHLGMTGSANTAQWIAEAFDNRAAADRFAPFSISRFT